MYEHRTEPILPRAQFLRRVALHFLAAVGWVLASLGAGVLGYHFLGRLPWVDAFLNASMILGGMGPVDALQTNSGKVFASLYALFSGLAFLVTAGILAAPVLHRLLHRLHLEAEDEEKDSSSS